MGIRDEASSIRTTIERCRNHTLRCRALSDGCDVAVRTRGEGYQVSASLALEDLIWNIERLSSTVIRNPTRQLVASRGRTTESQGIAVERQVVDGAGVVRRPQVCRTCGRAEQR